MVYGYKETLIDDILDIINNPEKERTPYIYLVKENDLLIKANTRLADIIKSYDPEYFKKDKDTKDKETYNK